MRSLEWYFFFLSLLVCVFAFLRAFGLAWYLVEGDGRCDNLYPLPLDSFLIGVVAVVDLTLQDEARALAYILLGKAGELWIKDSDIVPLGAVFDLCPRATASKSEDFLKVVGLQTTFPASRLEGELVVLLAKDG